MNKIYIVGVGLIGGSMALDLRVSNPNITIVGIDSNREHLAKAKTKGIIDAESTIGEIKNADVIILAIPVDNALVTLPKILDNVEVTTLVLDVGSTKQKICNLVSKHRNRRNFLASHPIAGTEFSGPNAAINNLFKNKTNIVCEVEKTAFKLQERALKLFSILGMRIRYMDAKSHDKHLAYVSHLSHISSFMLGKTVINEEKNEKDIFDLAGSGFESTVRLAKSSPAMWTPIFSHNKTNVVEALDAYIDNLKHFRGLLASDSFPSVYQEMENTNTIKTILKGIE
ncbi:MAG: prephenate dehydrogenase [Bacteroidetes bacterium MedPE-SWsnd-G2]|nr:MAG: prephenate dehydrogenase [Bacteroidetes bacterium MedPE-SWsnd-G2]